MKDDGTKSLFKVSHKFKKIWKDVKKYRSQMKFKKFLTNYSVNFESPYFLKQTQKERREMVWRFGKMTKE